jgi:hypothetical protein
MLIMGALCTLVVTGASSHAGTIKFGDYTWVVRSSARGGPGPNYWDPNNVWVDDQGYLHLRLNQRDGRWYCSEVYTQNRLGFGRYQFWISGPVDKLDRNVVFGLFNYPTGDVGRDGTHEIDIEFSTWGSTNAPIGNYTVWPATNGVRRESKSFPFTLKNDQSTHRFTWSPAEVFFQSQYGHHDDNGEPFTSWVFRPSNATARISQKPMPVHINLWCFSGRPPTDSQPVELIVRAFKFTPL